MGNNLLLEQNDNNTHARQQDYTECFMTRYHVHMNLKAITQNK